MKQATPITSSTAPRQKQGPFFTKSPVTIAPKDEKGPSKADIEKSKKQRDAIVLFWNDLKNWFSGEGRKLAGSGFDESVDYLSTNFQSGESMEGTVKVGRSAPMVYVGKKYLTEKDPDVRKAAIRAELDKIDVYRFDNALIDDEDTTNTAIIGKIDAMDVLGRDAYLKRMNGKTFIKNEKMKNLIRRKMPSTALMEGAVAGMNDGFELQFGNIKIIVMPDAFGSSQVPADEAHTEITRTDANTYKTYPRYTWDGKNKINYVDPTSVPQLTYQVQTHYGPNSDPSFTSGYGVGTRPEDTTAVTKSIRFHEGMHGTVFIQHIRDNIASNEFPVFTGKLKDNKREFENIVEDYKKKVMAFDQMIRDAIEASTQDVDCVGKTIEQYYTAKG
ncbi:MAG TPA: hypothetical protein VGD35_00115, partial [Chitinophaga sp.]